MHSSSRSSAQSWFAPNLNWRGKKALIPVETCYRILNAFSWFVCAIATFGLIMAYGREPVLMKANPLFWLVAAVQVPTIAAALFRRLPFTWRYAALASNLLVFSICASAVVGITPNWAFQVTLLVATASLFFGTRAGLAMVVVICVTHVFVAGGWVAGWLPAFMPGPEASSTFMDYTAAVVWLRVLLVAAAFLAALVLLMRYVLHDLNTALRDSNRALQQLAVEQEHRARAEEARLRAELAVREAQKFDALGRLASGVAHDFNNILCVMKCWSSLLAEDTQEPQVREAMAEIRRATESAEQMTQHLLAFSRSDTPKREVIDLSELIRRESKTLSRLLPNVEVSANTGKAIHVRLGRGQMQEIILNLAINARDAMPRGGRFALNLTSEPRTGNNGLPAGRYARLEISDTGEGMSSAVMARIFEPFYTTKQNGKGTGLGLAIVYGMVAGAGGQITVDSEPGCGTRFSLVLPEADPTEAPQEIRAAAITTRVRCRVLIVETQGEIRALVERILAREGFPVMTAADGESASALLRVPGARFGLLVIDAAMPGLPATDVIRQALELNPECHVIVTTTQSPDGTLLGGIESGRYQHLMKPFDAGQLREAVNTVLSQPVKVPAI